MPSPPEVGIQVIGSGCPFQEVRCNTPRGINYVLCGNIIFSVSDKVRGPADIVRNRRFTSSHKSDYTYALAPAKEAWSRFKSIYRKIIEMTPVRKLYLPVRG